MCHQQQWLPPRPQLLLDLHSSRPLSIACRLYYVHYLALVRLPQPGTPPTAERSSSCRPLHPVRVLGSNSLRRTVSSSEHPHPVAPGRRDFISGPCLVRLAQRRFDACYCVGFPRSIPPWHLRGSRWRIRGPVGRSASFSRPWHRGNRAPAIEGHR
jgi:hypothetical protein